MEPAEDLLTHLITCTTNGWAEVQEKVPGLASERPLHDSDDSREDPRRRTSPTGMGNSYTRARGIHQEHRDTVRRHHAQENARRPGNVAVALPDDPQSVGMIPVLDPMDMDQLPVDLAGMGHSLQTRGAGQALPGFAGARRRRLREQAKIQGAFCCPPGWTRDALNQPGKSFLPDRMHPGPCSPG